MTIEVPIWGQDGVYPARLDRAFIEQVMHGAERVFTGMQVTQDGSGSFNVVCGTGAAAVIGDDSALQGMYFGRCTVAETIAVPPSPGSGTRTDLVVFRINDQQAGGGGAPGTIEGVFEVIEGATRLTPPDTAVPLAELNRTSTESAILTSAIIDVRPIGAYPYTVSLSTPPAGFGVEGDLWVVVT